MMILTESYKMFFQNKTFEPTFSLLFGYFVIAVLGSLLFAWVSTRRQ